MATPRTLALRIARRVAARYTHPVVRLGRNFQLAGGFAACDAAFRNLTAAQSKRRSSQLLEAAILPFVEPNRCPGSTPARCREPARMGDKAKPPVLRIYRRLCCLRAPTKQNSSDRQVLGDVRFVPKADSCTATKIVCV
jgi:hypothetical protein